MKYCICPNYVWTYPDICEYEHSKKTAELYCLRGGISAFQLILWDAPVDTLTVTLEGFDCEKYKMIPIPVESCPGIEEPLPHFPERQFPFSVHDCLMPIENTAKCSEGNCALYFAIPVKDEDISGKVLIECGEERISFPVFVKASRAHLPDECLNIGMGCDFHHMAKYHNIDCREDYERAESAYMALLRRQHQNMIYLHGPWAKFENGEWKFFFRHFNSFAKKALDMGFKKLLIHGVGFRRAWDAPDIMNGNIDLLSLEGYKYLDAYLTALRENLREQGWLNKDIFYLGLCDEPNDVNAMPYRALAGVVRRIIPEIKLYDATSGAPIYGALDIWIPRADEYEKHREIFDYYKERGDEVWHYVCLYPREEGYINRFLDIPLLSTRYLFWGNYRYGLTGYIHWTVNCYQNDCNPFEVSCPRHINAGSESILPPGDDKLIYPGNNKDPWMSIRLENHRESAEEYAMLKVIEKKDKALADSICNRVLRSFKDVEFDPEEFEKCRQKLIEAYEAAVE